MSGISDPEDAPQVLPLKDTALRLIVGLGNPGDEYRHNRHNLGFRVVEELAIRQGLVFKPQGSSYLVAVDEVRPDRIVLLKPRTYMNRSGRAVKAWSDDSGVAVTGGPQLSEAVRPLVVCDDLNLPLGSVRLRPRGSSGGQNGLASVIEHLAGEEFPRLRLGIAPLDRDIDPSVWPDHVLADFDPEELPVADEMVAHATAALEFWLIHGLEPAISCFNRRVRPDPEQAE